MNKETPRIRSLLRQADRNVKSGKFAAAESLYRQILDESPESTAAWLGLAHVSTEDGTKQAAYERVLELDEGNTEARVGLSDLQDKSIEGPKLSEDAVRDKVAVKVIPLADGQENNLKEVSQEHYHNEIDNAAADSHPEIIDDHDHGTGHDQGHTALLDPEAELFCYRHPTRSTSLRCYKCNKPICSECAVKTPVGYLCPTCQREAEDAFYNNKVTDYIVAALVALPLSLIAGSLVVRFSGGIFMILLFIFAGGAVGGFIARLSKRAIGRRRGRFIPHVVTACIIIGVVFFAWPWLLVLITGVGGALFKLAGIGVYLFTAASSAFYWAR